MGRGHHPVDVDRRVQIAEQTISHIHDQDWDSDHLVDGDSAQNKQFPHSPNT